MKRRSKAGGEAIKGQRRKAPEPKRHNMPKAVAQSISSSSGTETEVARLTRELNEARELQSATSEVLRIISNTPSELDPVLKTILANATNLCQATLGVMYLVDGHAFRTLVTYLRGPAGYEIAPPPPAWVWTGFYGGVHVGAAASTANFADPSGSSIFGDNVITPGFLAGGQIGFNWQAPRSPWVFGLEANLNWLDSDGTNTCLAYSSLYVSARACFG